VYEAGHGGVQLGEQPLLVGLLVGVQVEAAQRHGEHPGGDARLDAAGDQVELRSQGAPAAGTGGLRGVGVLVRGL
jgi:hypothetical protein